MFVNTRINQIDNYYLVTTMLFIAVACTNSTLKKDTESTNLVSIKEDSIPNNETEVSCKLIKNEKRLTEIVDSIEKVYGKAGYACRCYLDDVTSNDSHKIVVQFLKDTEFSHQGVAMLKYDTIKGIFSNYDMLHEH